jgi:hypothetical protein
VTDYNQNSSVDPVPVEVFEAVATGAKSKQLIASFIAYNGSSD